MFQAASSDPSALLDFVLNELESQLQEQVGAFLGTGGAQKLLRTSAFRETRQKQLPAQTNVRVVPTDESYPTIASLVQAMEARRDAAENLARKRILEKEIDFLMACNRAIEESLTSGVARIMAK